MITVVILQKSAELTQCICKSTPQTRKFLLVSWFIAQVMRFFYIRVTSNEIFARVKSYFYYLLHELQVNFYVRPTSYYLLHKLGLQCWLCKASPLQLLFISMFCSFKNQVFPMRYSWAMYFMNECSNIKNYNQLFFHMWSVSTFLWPIPCSI